MISFNNPFKCQVKKPSRVGTETNSVFNSNSFLLIYHSANGGGRSLKFLQVLADYCHVNNAVYAGK